MPSKELSDKDYSCHYITNHNIKIMSCFHVEVLKTGPKVSLVDCLERHQHTNVCIY